MAITVQMRTQISELYVALFGRAPDGEGLGFWVSLLDSGTPLATIANMMFATEPARAYYPLFMTNAEIVTAFYVNVLGRSPDAEGLAFWTAAMNEPGATPGTVITRMIDNVAHYTGTDPAGLTSQALFNNKVEVAQYYGEHNGTIEGASGVLSGVTADHATVVAVKAAIDAGTVQGVNQGQIINFTANVDTLVGTNGNDTFNGVVNAPFASTVTPLDSANGGLGMDTVNIADEDGGGFNLADLTLLGIERFNLVSSGGLFNGALDVTKIAGLTNLSVTLQDMFNDQAITAGPGTAVVVNVTNDDDDLTVNGGSTVVINSNNVSDNSFDDITVNGGTGTTSVTVNQTGTAGNAAMVFINDVHALDPTKSAVLTSVALSGLTGGDALITSNVLTSLSISKSSADVDVVAAAGTRTLNVTLDQVDGADTDITDATATTLGINFTGKASGGTNLDFHAAAAKTVNINSSADKTSVIDDLDTGVATAINISGTAGLTITDINVAAAAVFDASTASGAIKITETLGVSNGFKGGSGADTITIGAHKTAITMGAGNDTVNLTGATLGTGGSVDAGDGTNDTLVATAADLTTLSTSGTASKFTNFETLKATDKLTNASIIDVSNFLTIANFIAGQGVQSGHEANVNHLGPNATVELAGALDANTGTLFIDEAVNSANDVLTLKLNGSFAGNNDPTADLITGFTMTVKTGQIETVNVISTGKNTTTITTPVDNFKADFVTNTLVLTDNALKTMTITGDQVFAFAANAGMTGLSTVDAGALAPIAETTGILTNQTLGFVFDGTALNSQMKITGSATTGNVILGGANQDTIIGGAKSDFLMGYFGGDFLTGNGGNDAFYLASSGESTLASMDTISDFIANTKANATSDGAATDTKTWTGDVIVINDTAGMTKVAATAQANATDAQIYIQTVAGSTTDTFVAALDSSTGRLYMDWNSDGVIDSVVLLTGATSISAAAFLLT
jgi:hypothetical protein